MREHRAKSGKLIYYVTRRELEALPGYRSNDRKGRACCPIHAGDNPTALSIDWGTGWASCWSCGDAWAIRVEDHPDTMPVPNQYQTSAKPLPKRFQSAPRNARIPPRRDDCGPHDQRPAEHDRGALRANLAVAIETAVKRLPGSPGETYLDGRGIPSDVARSLRLGWGAAGKLAGRIVFPLCGPDGLATSAMGRAANDHTRPKYKALPSDKGYVKTLFNGGAIAQAKWTGYPLIVVEGPLDAAACVAAGLPLTVALCGAAYAHPEHFGGLQTVILALDADDTGHRARRALWLDLTARGVDVLILPAAALDGAKDLGEYWQRFRTMPTQLLGRVIGPHMQRVPGHVMHAGTFHARAAESEPSWQEGTPMTPLEWSTIEELQQRTAEHQRYSTMTPDDLPADLKTEAEALATELGNDLDALTELWADLRRREHLLTHEECAAAHYALTLAIAQQRCMIV